MSIKYAVYNPEDGNNTIVDTLEEAEQLFWTRVLKIAHTYFHGTAYMTVEINDETGVETWTNQSGDIIDKPKTHAELIELMSKFGKVANMTPTPVEILP